MTHHDKRVRNAIFFLVAAVGLNASAFAAPKITTVTLEKNSDTGTPQLVISGSGFTSKKHAKPLHYFDFENQQLGSNLQASHSNSSIITNGVITDETTPTKSGSSMRFKVEQDPSEIAIPEINFSSDQLYVYFHRRYNFSIGDSGTWGNSGFNLKTNRLWSRTKNNIYIGYQGKEGNKSGRIYPEYTADGGSVWTGSRLPQLENRWAQEEIIYQAGDIGVKNGRFDLIRDGVPAHSAVFRMRTSSYPEPYSQLVFDQISNGVAEDRALYIYYDNIYIDDSFHRVYVSEGPTFSEAGLRLIQVPTEWNDNKISVDFSPGSSSVSNLFVYVVDSNGNANQSGVKVCQQGCLSPPSPPPVVGVD